MTNDQATAILADILAGIAPEADLSTVKDAEVLREALDLDSMDLLAVYTGLKEKAGVEIPEADYPRVTTKGALVAYVAAKGG